MWRLSGHPILQAPTGSIAGPELCANVCREGGVGAMGLTWTEPEHARLEVRKVWQMLRPGCAHDVGEDRAVSGLNGSFQANFVLHFEPKALIPALEEGVPAVTFSWGMPDAFVDLVRSFGAKLGIQVVNAEAAKRAIDLGADFLVCQGVEAGGHVQSSTPLQGVLEQVLPIAGGTPVVASGGLADREDVVRVLHLGASAAMLGTRFVATRESRAHPTYKQMLVDARDTALTVCFDGGWPAAQHRVLRNKTFTDWEAAGCPPAGARPGEGEELSEDILRYEDAAPREGVSGRIEEMCLYAGTGVGKIRDIPSAADLVGELAGAERCR